MSAVGVVQAFASNYAQARARFLEAAATAGLPLQSHPHPLPGSEGEGMSRLVSESCDFRVSIPMRGHISSLNASTAAAILLYEAVRQRSAE